MDDLEKKLNNLDKLFEEAHSLKEEASEKNEQDNGVFIVINPHNQVGTLKTKYKYRLVPQEGIVENNIKDEAKEITEHAEEVINKPDKKEIVVEEENTKLIELPNELLPTVQKEQEYPLMVQKEQVRALTKVGSVVTSILLALVTLTIGVILALVFK